MENPPKNDKDSESPENDKESESAKKVKPPLSPEYEHVLRECVPAIMRFATINAFPGMAQPEMYVMFVNGCLYMTDLFIFYKRRNYYLSVSERGEGRGKTGKRK